MEENFIREDVACQGKGQQSLKEPLVTIPRSTPRDN